MLPNTDFVSAHCYHQLTQADPASLLMTAKQQGCCLQCSSSRVAVWAGVAAEATRCTCVEHLLQLLHVGHALLHLVQDELLLLLGGLRGSSRRCPASKGLHDRVDSRAATARGHAAHGGPHPNPSWG